MDQPLSVVMPVRNAGPYLDPAIHSILTQSYGNFEFIIGDDDSTDGSRERAREWARRDPRIRLVEAREHLGPVGSSNLVAMEARHPIVARMDADDISRSDRLRRQLDALQEHSDAVLVGSLFDCVDASGKFTRGRDRSFLFRTDLLPPIAHGSIMYRREAFLRVGGYREHCAYFEDVDLYLRLARQGRVLVILEPIFTYRFSAASGRLNANEHQIEDTISYFFHQAATSSLADDPFPITRRDDTRRTDPMAIIRLAALRLWSGQRPAVIGRLFRRSVLGWNRASLRALVWVLWASASPTSMRLCLRARSKWRDGVAGRRLDDNQIYEWQPLNRLAPCRPVGSSVLTGDFGDFKDVPGPANGSNSLFHDAKSSGSAR